MKTEESKSNGSMIYLFQQGLLVENENQDRSNFYLLSPGTIALVFLAVTFGEVPSNIDEFESYMHGVVLPYDHCHEELCRMHPRAASVLSNIGVGTAWAHNVVFRPHYFTRKLSLPIRD